jgi:MFS family permease
LFIYSQDGPFIYDTNAQGIILSCYFWGYLVSQIPGAFIAQKLSAKWVMWFSVFINVICTLLTPAAARIGVWAVVLMRVLEGKIKLIFTQIFTYLFCPDYRHWRRCNFPSGTHFNRIVGTTN